METRQVNRPFRPPDDAEAITSDTDGERKPSKDPGGGDGRRPDAPTEPSDQPEDTRDGRGFESQAGQIEGRDDVEGVEGCRGGDGGSKRRNTSTKREV